MNYQIKTALKVLALASGIVIVFASVISLTQMVDDINPDCLEIAQEAQATLQTIIDEASTK